MIRLYMARHGETEFNRKRVYYGWMDVPMNENGVAQCQCLKKKLSDIGFDAVITSSLDRAIHSGQIIGELEKSELVILEDLKELNFGAWEGLHFSEIEKNYNSDWLGWCKDWINYCIPGGESFTQFYNRVKKTLESLLKAYVDKTVLLITHEGTMKVIATILMNLEQTDYWKFSFEFGKYSMFEIQEENTIIRKINC